MKSGCLALGTVYIFFFKKTFQSGFWTKNDMYTDPSSLNEHTAIITFNLSADHCTAVKRPMVFKQLIVAPLFESILR